MVARTNGMHAVGYGASGRCSCSGRGQLQRPAARARAKCKHTGGCGNPGCSCALQSLALGMHTAVEAGERGQDNSMQVATQLERLKLLK